MKILKILAVSCLALLLLALPVLAMTQAKDQPAPVQVPVLVPTQINVPGFSQWDLGTYVGLSAAVIGVVGALKIFFKKWVTGKEKYFGLGLSYAFGIATKLFIPGAYKDINWVIFLISLLLVAAGAKFGHDHFVNEIIRNKKEGDKK